ncbi:MAG: hypothetical protein OdinLCB4_006115 [Candidatus Odinarchaeum yellowstonii]|uniref:Uncharacterized protein n=1 Tax=Odinarchaeota yellowstonii (strain LCB_4) TaxID=1841599 RepID=A0AAF0IB40_ODILC|nr:MAG: hypothetical protein OdinLCB4_006115 [Candidatus Odinarchaeum yellowstonii]
MPFITKTVVCSNCGAPLIYESGENIITCKYCGATQLLDVSKPFILDHSMLPLKYGEDKIDGILLDWMKEGFLKPKDLAKKSRIESKELKFLPFWIISVKAETFYEGLFERINPPVRKKGSIVKEYDWRVLGRKGSSFPIREFEISLSRRVPFNYLKIPANCSVLNSEIDEVNAKKIAEQEIEAHHKMLALDLVDRIIDFKTSFEFKSVIYLHAPVWFIVYKYKSELFKVLVDGNSGLVIKGEFPV